MWIGENKEQYDLFTVGSLYSWDYDIDVVLYLLSIIKISLEFIRQIVDKRKRILVD